MAYEASRKVRFGACDAAGIAYYPALFELCDGVIEDWTADVLGVPRRELHLEQGLALPTVDMRATFGSPARLGDRLDMVLHVRRVGNSSVDLALTAAVAGRECFSITYRQVLMEMEGARSLAWPGEWRERLEAAIEGTDQ
ncbi:acyl-CoA thioesterase [Sphingomicrobium aestuariivivum]|uniref:acyl-CoA thioesterase n=1 Tax=Sphingomicrobium aestuariivivum TaxID=1582356 RepID=UPI001FD68128|nr:thioesterase family protein [Sphingomicrobium aestuariivivum]MCJ8191893.1 thioesterase family protein [Sphingomicrobium aestuariivivum]